MTVMSLHKHASIRVAYVVASQMWNHLAHAACAATMLVLLCAGVIADYDPNCLFADPVRVKRQAATY
jgi:hypothetical protein